MLNRQKSVGSSSSIGQQLHKRRTFINNTQNNYVTKKPKNKVTKHGASFIIGSESTKSNGKSKSGAANLFQQIASKMQYIRVKTSKDNSKSTTPQTTDEKNQEQDRGNYFKKLEFKSSDNNDEEDIENSEDIEDR